MPPIRQSIAGKIKLRFSPLFHKRNWKIKRNEHIDAIAPQPKFKVTNSSYYTRTIGKQIHKIFPQAGVAAQRKLRRDLEDRIEFEMNDSRPNIVMPARVSGAVTRQDYLRLDKIRRMFSEELEDLKAVRKDMARQ